MSPKIIGRIAQWLPRNALRLRRLRLRWLENRLRHIYDTHRGSFPMRLHGFPIQLNGGNPYPFLIADHNLFNQPLVELIRHVSTHLQRKLIVIDVGASLGNTVLLLQEQTFATIARIHSVEANEEFFALLQQNTARFPSVILHRAMLAAENKDVPSLVHHHRGSATATGDTTVRATTLDALLLECEPHYDVLKIDIDGSDGEALAGAKQLLQRDHPAVIFEWHPALIERAGNKPQTPFITLQEAGYAHFLWFRNTGHFSHFSRGNDLEIETWDRYLRAMQPQEDPHFDIVALPPRFEDLSFRISSLGVLR